ncbi:type II toxin-antitoxin system death-on-curing family toxin [Paenibacillus melissococcoides]|uniref:Type II toxin-antitoxin system death-on-curing family toxin n=1 Tax=Paenibacillus melissococcoides TaxID=2912268 RepID=A0ABN8U0U7_9BACL|nr:MULTISPECIES: type II toxin-antitoxin system death-on-curing family toxin [Paenibacillus]MEB9893457.1 type II toxin-antitoxin system death-on-curing family toxin [Bacillus cereus]CAH8244688.1 type II toxin-antitoxin system death-on-curing family toxin [Paenibacillus melissococcoides]CAH8708682.1 type II toxin-antitoxin system death-on-curing family toxin [Paenibacillus melissococcoides]CAH8709429.1 type II toxin-antitoxin system death-on-curing family toxin [Paenibacillus melissococcoides]G
MVKYLTKEEVVAGHYFMMKQMRDMEQAGVKDHSLLESAVYRPEQSVFGEDAYPTLFEKAAALGDSLAKNHCFHNGNKRTAYLSVKSFLKINGYHLKMEREFAVNFMVDIVNGKYSIADMAQIFAENCIKM